MQSIEGVLYCPNPFMDLRSTPKKLKVYKPYGFIEVPYCPYIINNDSRKCFNIGNPRDIKNIHLEINT
jgi:hypothetical protein